MQQPYNVGDIVYIFYRNPHIQDVANIQEAAVVYHPEQPEELALFLFETYYPISNDMLIFQARWRLSKPIISIFIEGGLL